MPAFGSNFMIGVKAGEDMSSTSSPVQFNMVKQDAADPYGVKKITAATDRPVGILQDKPKNGQACLVQYVGECFARAGETMNPGQLVGVGGTTNTFGRVFKVQYASAADDVADRWIIGTAMQKATLAGQIIRVQLQQPILAGKDA